MARLPRLAIAGHPHYLLQRGNNGQAVVLDDADRRACLESLRGAALMHGVAIHAYVLLDNEIQLLATPREGRALGRMMQSLGRRYVGLFNRRHGRTGTLWEGRFRGTVIETERYFLSCLASIELAPVREGAAPDAQSYEWSSAAHHLGLRRDPLVTDHPAYWALGNTPFERELAYRRQLEHGLTRTDQAALAGAARKGWVLGSDAFVAQLSALTERPLRPRARGRPPKSPSPIKTQPNKTS